MQKTSGSWVKGEQQILSWEKFLRSLWKRAKCKKSWSREGKLEVKIWKGKEILEKSVEER